MFVMGRCVGWPGVGGVSPSMEISAISTNSRSRIFLTTLGDRVAAGLNGPVVRREAVEAEVVGMGSVTVAETDCSYEHIEPCSRRGENRETRNCSR